MVTTAESYNCKDDAMAFTDPQSLTIAGSAVSLPRVSAGINASTYQSNDGLVSELVSSTYGKRTRRAMRIGHSKIAGDPLVTTVNQKYSMSATLVVDVPVAGYTVAQQKEVVDAFVAYLAASSGAIVTKFLGGES